MSGVGAREDADAQHFTRGQDHSMVKLLDSLARSARTDGGDDGPAKSGRRIVLSGEVRKSEIHLQNPLGSCDGEHVFGFEEEESRRVVEQLKGGTLSWTPQELMRLAGEFPPPPTE